MSAPSTDKWTAHHFLGGLVVGVAAAVFVPKHKYEVAIAIIIGFEMIEQNIFASWYKLIPEEPLTNTILDIIVGGIGASITIFLSRGV